jgi:hypothetical protein
VLVVGVRHETRASTAGDTCAKGSNVTAAKAAYVSSAKAAHVASAKATHAAATVSSTATASGLCTRCKKASCKHCGCQHHYHSSFHDILHLVGRMIRHRIWSDVGVSPQRERQRCDRLEMGVLICCLYSILVETIRIERPACTANRT